MRNQERLSKLSRKTQLRQGAAGIQAKFQGPEYLCLSATGLDHTQGVIALGHVEWWGKSEESSRSKFLQFSCYTRWLTQSHNENINPLLPAHPRLLASGEDTMFLSIVYLTPTTVRPLVIDQLMFTE